VIGGYFDPEFAEPTRRLWALMRNGEYRFVVSEVVTTEVFHAPIEVRELFAETFPESIEVREEAKVLADAYVEAKVVSGRYRDDALHVAVCVLEGIGLLASWNFKHLVNLRREEGFNAINLLRGLPMVRIVSPLELLNDEEDDEQEEDTNA
jgi:predicted nucleic acid-binding protein